MPQPAQQQRGLPMRAPQLRVNCAGINADPPAKVLTSAEGISAGFMTPR